jgi:hypothetical protein
MPTDEDFYGTYNDLYLCRVEMESYNMEALSMAHEQLQQQLNSERLLRETAEEERLRIKASMFRNYTMLCFDISSASNQKSHFITFDH